MQNELILMATLAVIYLGVLFFYKTLGKSGLYVWTAIATLCANIEVLILVEAFGMEQTLGNILFASTFLVTDILSEIHGKKAANKAVKIGIMTSIAFVVITQSWFLYDPSVNDFVMPSIQTVFSNTPRLVLVSLAVYAIAQGFDVWFYHFIWEKTTKLWGDSKRGLWIRNNGSTLISQLLNTILFNFGAFWGIYDFSTLVAITISTYVIYVVTSLVDTPLVYWARRMKVKEG
ncbi:MAG: queuosine precursor transporter [Eubacteriales bacterium]